MYVLSRHRHTHHIYRYIVDDVIVGEGLGPGSLCRRAIEHYDGSLCGPMGDAGLLAASGASFHAFDEEIQEKRIKANENSMKTIKIQGKTYEIPSF